MGRNRALGSPYQTETVTEDFTTNHSVDAYLVDAVPLVVTLDPYAVNFDQVVIQDVTNTAGTHPIPSTRAPARPSSTATAAASPSVPTAAACC